MFGFGVFPVGTSPAGAFVQERAAVGAAASTAARNIDPVSRDYTNTVMPQGVQAAFLALATSVKSSIDRELGRLPLHTGRMGTDFEQRVRDAVALALEPVIRRGLILLRSVSVLRSVRGTRIDVRVFDVLENAEFTVTA